MIRPNLRDINELGGIHKAAPEKYVEPDEEDCGPKTSLVRSVEISSCQSCFKNESCETPCCSNEEERSAAETVNLGQLALIFDDGIKC